KLHLTPLPLVAGQPRQRVVGAPELEGAAALQVLAFEKQLGADAAVDGPGRGDGRVVRGARNLPGRAFDVGTGRKGHFNAPLTSSYTFLTAIGPCDFASVHDAYSPKSARLIASSTGHARVVKPRSLRDDRPQRLVISRELLAQH